MTTAISSQKGGTGKTSTSISLAAGLARKGKRTLLVDIDSQANSSKVLLPDYLRVPKEQTIYTTILQRKALPIHPTSIANLAVVPSHILLSNTDVELTTAIDHREERLKRQLAPLAAHYDGKASYGEGLVVAEMPRLSRLSRIRDKPPQEMASQESLKQHRISPPPGQQPSNCGERIQG